MEYEEKLTINGKNIVFLRDRKPTENESVRGEQEDMKLLMYDVTDPSLVPSNYDKPDGTPMTLMKGEGIRVDLSKRTIEEMSFWHRSADFDELIICFQGSIKWETDLGDAEMKPGQMLLIPRGIAHRAIPGESGGTNILIEVKIWSPLEEIIPGFDGTKK
ncbi:MAG: homogentisate 1,2-dioxygenase [Thermodesulfobacteriota bacterium]|nr:homogentisate 1,2-dioxygenase [Thermodesulfobacteriota bacterium]